MSLFCQSCGVRPGKFWRNQGVVAPAILLCRKCDAIAVERRVGASRVTGFPGHNRGKKFVPGIGYISRT